MRVLILNYEYPPLGGGAGNATYSILQQFAKMDGVEIDLVTSSASGFRIERPSKNICLHFLDINKQGNLHYQTGVDLLRFAWSSYFYARTLVDRHKIQLIHAFFGIPSGFTAMQFDVPFIVSLRGSDVPHYNERFELLDHLLFAALSRRIWKKAAMVVANSTGLKELALETSPEQHIAVIPNGVDTDLFSPCTPRRPKDGIMRLVSTGRLIKRKGYEYLLEALREQGEYELVLIGDGDIRNHLEERARLLGVSVQFAGRLERDNVISQLRDADLFVLPSLNEGMSNSILEALACGLPVIATNVGGSEELVGDGKNGFVVERGSVVALGEALSRYAHDRTLLEQHGIASRQIALTMSWEQVSQWYLRLYEKAVSRRDGAACS